MNMLFLKKKKINYNDKLKIVFILSILCFIIYISDFLFIKFFNKKENSALLKSELLTIDSGIDNLLSEYGIKKEWESKQAYQINDKLIRYERVIKIPYKFPIVELNKEISLFCEKYNANTSSKEDLKNQIIYLQVFKNGRVIQTIKFITDPSIERNIGDIVLIVKDINNLNELQKPLVIRSPYFSTFILDYKKDNTEVTTFLNKISKDFIFYIDVKEGDVDEEYDISLKMDSTKVYRLLRRIIRNNEYVKGFFITFEKYDDEFYKMLANEIKKLSKKMILKSNIKEIIMEDNGNNNFSDILNEVNLKGSCICLIDINKNNVKLLFDELKKVQKLGYRFVSLQ
ncbi:MAG TPA: hypothetical protein VIR55_13585 [Ignavibacteria bacterium]